MGSPSSQYSIVICSSKMTIEKIADEYGVSEEDVRAVLTYASEWIEQEEYHLVGFNHRHR